MVKHNDSCTNAKLLETQSKLQRIDKGIILVAYKVVAKLYISIQRETLAGRTEAQFSKNRQTSIFKFIIDKKSQTETGAQIGVELITIA